MVGSVTSSWLGGPWPAFCCWLAIIGEQKRKKTARAKNIYAERAVVRRDGRGLYRARKNPHPSKQTMNRYVALATLRQRRERCSENGRKRKGDSANNRVFLLAKKAPGKRCFLHLGGQQQHRHQQNGGEMDEETRETETYVQKGGRGTNETVCLSRP